MGNAERQVLTADSEPPEAAMGRWRFDRSDRRQAAGGHKPTVTTVGLPTRWLAWDRAVRSSFDAEAGNRRQTLALSCAAPAVHPACRPDVRSGVAQDLASLIPISDGDVGSQSARVAIGSCPAQSDPRTCT